MPKKNDLTEDERAAVASLICEDPERAA